MNTLEPQPAKMPAKTEPDVFPLYVKLHPEQLALLQRLEAKLDAHEETDVLEDLRTLSEAQVLELWPQLTHDDLYRHRSNGNLKTLNSGRKVLYPVAELKRFLKENLGQKLSTKPPTKEERIRLKARNQKKRLEP